jgi:hypothetical protein
VESTEDKDELRISFITIKEMSIKERSREERDVASKHLYASLSSHSHFKFPRQLRRKKGSRSTTLHPSGTVTITPWENA